MISQRTWITNCCQGVADFSSSHRDLFHFKQCFWRLQPAWDASYGPGQILHCSWAWGLGRPHSLSDLHRFPPMDATKSSPLQICVSLVTEPHQKKPEQNLAACKAWAMWREAGGRMWEAMGLDGWGHRMDRQTASAVLWFVPAPVLCYSSSIIGFPAHPTPPQPFHSRKALVFPRNSSAPDGPCDLHTCEKLWLQLLWALPAPTQSLTVRSPELSVRVQNYQLWSKINPRVSVCCWPYGSGWGHFCGDIGGVFGLFLSPCLAQLWCPFSIIELFTFARLSEKAA